MFVFSNNQFYLNFSNIYCIATMSGSKNVKKILSKYKREIQASYMQSNLKLNLKNKIDIPCKRLSWT